jgi:DNA-binding IclR family transcriptional regulator
MDYPSESGEQALPQAGGNIQVIDRAMALMRTIAVAPRQHTAQELAAIHGLNRTTTWRILVSLEHNGLVFRDPSTQRYGVGIDLVRLAEAADVGPLIRVARGLLQELAEQVQEQVSLGLPRHLGFSYVEHLQPHGASPVPRWLGQSGPLHATASGKVLLSRLSLTERDAVLPSHLERFTSKTIVNRASLDRQLVEIRKQGFALGIGEHDELTSAICAVAADTRDDRLVAIVDVWGPAQRLNRKRLREIAPLVRDAAVEIGRRMGQRDAERARESLHSE